MVRSLKPSKVVLFDIDYTLFDSDTFRKKVYQAISEVIGEDNADRLHSLYAGIVDEYGYFNPQVFFKRVAKNLSNKDKAKLRKTIWRKENFEGNFFRETITVLSRLIPITRVGIFSKGDSTWQRAKLSAIAHLFDEKHIHIHVSKKQALPDIIKKYKKYKLYLVDDALDVLYKAKKLKKDVFVIWVKRGHYAKTQNPIPGFKPDAQVVDLLKIVDIVRSH